MNLSIFKPKSSAAATEVSQPAETPRATVESLEDVLLELAKWGNPRVSMPSTSSKGWYSCIDVNITPTGAKFEVASDFGMATPLAAALQCRERLMASVKAIGGAA